MAAISVDEIQRDFLSYLRRVQAGETLVIVQADEPVAELKPVTAGKRERRPFGLCAGELEASDDFNDPLPEEILKQFEGH